MIITISGRAGSGKSTSGRLLAKRLHTKFYSMGDVRRQMAKDMGLTIAELNKIAEKDPASDVKVDKYQAKLAKKIKNFVIDSRLGYLFIPKSLKVYLDADVNTRAKRIFNDAKNRKGVETTKSIADAKKELISRENSDIKRYEKLYKTNPYNPEHYDLVIDTTDLTIKQTADMILKYLKTLK
jgi:cytidylate kinase